MGLTEVCRRRRWVTTRVQAQKISFRNLKRIVTELGEDIPDDELRVRSHGSRCSVVVSGRTGRCGLQRVVRRRCRWTWPRDEQCRPQSACHRCRTGLSCLCAVLPIPRPGCGAQEMISEADRDGDNLIDFDEFYRVMKKRSGNALDDLDSDDDI